MAILAAVGGKYERDEVVEIGYDLASAYDDDLVVLHVMSDKQFKEIRGKTDIQSPIRVTAGGETPGLAYRESQQKEEPYNLEMAVEDAAGVAETCVRRSLSGEDQSRITTTGRVGDPAEEIIDEAERLDARFIVVGGRKRSPVGKAVFGSTSQSVLLESRTPVVALTREE